MLKPRNHIARNPLLRKGGAHEREVTGKRQQQKQALNHEILDWELDTAQEHEQNIDCEKPIDDYDCSRD